MPTPSLYKGNGVSHYLWPIPPNKISRIPKAHGPAYDTPLDMSLSGVARTQYTEFPLPHVCGKKLMVRDGYDSFEILILKKLTLKYQF